MLNQSLVAYMKRTFPGSDGDSIEKFLVEGFGNSNSGQVVVASVFLYAKEVGKTAQEVLPILKKQYEDGWSFIHPDIRGDVDAPGKWGERNRNIIISVYSELGIPFPSNRSA